MSLILRVAAGQKQSSTESIHISSWFDWAGDTLKRGISRLLSKEGTSLAECRFTSFKEASGVAKGTTKDGRTWSCKITLVLSPEGISAEVEDFVVEGDVEVLPVPDEVEQAWALIESYAERLGRKLLVDSARHRIDSWRAGRPVELVDLKSQLKTLADRLKKLPTDAGEDLKVRNKDVRVINKAVTTIHGLPGGKN